MLESSSNIKDHTELLIIDTTQEQSDKASQFFFPKKTIVLFIICLPKMKCSYAILIKISSLSQRNITKHTSTHMKL